LVSADGAAADAAFLCDRDVTVFAAGTFAATGSAATTPSGMEADFPLDAFFADPADAGDCLTFDASFASVTGLVFPVADFAPAVAVGVLEEPLAFLGTGVALAADADPAGAAIPVSVWSGTSRPVEELPDADSPVVGTLFSRVTVSRGEAMHSPFHTGTRAQKITRMSKHPRQLWRLFRSEASRPAWRGIVRQRRNFAKIHRKPWSFSTPVGHEVLYSCTIQLLLMQ
jgi:hypothetical protein